jgi:hypothetical protein
MAVIVVGIAISIGAGLGIERRFQRREPRAQPAQHVFEHMVVANTQLLTDDLHVGMSVTKMPGEPRKIMRACRGDLDQRRWPSDHAHDALSSSTSPSPFGSAIACGRSSRNFVPRSPVNMIRRRWRSSASSTT